MNWKPDESIERTSVLNATYVSTYGSLLSFEKPSMLSHRKPSIISTGWRFFYKGKKWRIEVHTRSHRFTINAKATFDYIDRVSAWHLPRSSHSTFQQLFNMTTVFSKVAVVVALFFTTSSAFAPIAANRLSSRVRYLSFFYAVNFLDIFSSFSILLYTNIFNSIIV